MENPPKKFFRLGPGREVRLRYAYFITCRKIVKDDNTGEIKEIICTYDPATRGGDAPDGRKVKGTLHWVSGQHSIPAKVRLYDRLFLKEDPEEANDDFTDNINPESLVTLDNCRVEKSLENAGAGDTFQFERLGYFCIDSRDSSPDQLIFNRTITLRDTWAKLKKKKH